MKEAWRKPDSDKSPVRLPGQWKILLGNQKLKVLCPNGQLKSKTGCEHEFCHFFWHFNKCVWHFISKQVEGDSFNLIFGHYVQRREYKRFYRQFFNNIKYLVQSRAWSGNWFIALGCPLGLSHEKILSQPESNSVICCKAWNVCVHDSVYDFKLAVTLMWIFLDVLAKFARKPNPSDHIHSQAKVIY